MVREETHEETNNLKTPQCMARYVARRKLEVPMPAAMPCKTLVNCRGETCRNIGNHKTKYACIVDADESMRIRSKGAFKWYHEDHYCSERNKFTKLLQFGTQIYSYARCKGSSGQRMGQLEKYRQGS